MPAMSVAGKRTIPLGPEVSFFSEKSGPLTFSAVLLWTPSRMIGSPVRMFCVCADAFCIARYAVALHVPRLPLLGGGYYLNIATTDNRGALVAYDIQERLCPFRVRNPTDEYGLMRMEHRWLDTGES